MTITAEKTVKELALESLSATRVFEKLGIDYCCGGKLSLERACQAANVPFEQAVDALEMAELAAQASSKERNWAEAPLTELIAHIRNTHHKYTRDEIARLSPLADKVCRVHGAKHPELAEIRATFQALSAELTTHLMKEEMMLFPYIERMEEALAAKDPMLPSPFGSVSNPVAMMMHEHDDAGSALRDLRRASNDFTPPPEACVSYQTLYKALAEFESDLHRHIHLENNILFPRAVAMEQAR